MKLCLRRSEVNGLHCNNAKFRLQLAPGLPLAQNLSSDLTCMISRICMCECIRCTAGDWRKSRSLLLFMLKSTGILVKTSLRIPEHSEMLFAFTETALSRMQALLSTCPHTHLSPHDIGGRLLLLTEPILPSPKASSAVLRTFHLINGKLKKKRGGGTLKCNNVRWHLCSAKAKTDFWLHCSSKPAW